MTTLDITYEDGLRLSELSGQLAGLKYEAANMLAVHASALIRVFVLASILALILFALMRVFVGTPIETEYKSEYEVRQDRSSNLFHRYEIVRLAGQTTRKAQHYDQWKQEFVTYDELVDMPMKVEWKLNALGVVAMFWPWILPFAAVGIMWVSINAGVYMDIANVQGQIDAIMAKYGGIL